MDIQLKHTFDAPLDVVVRAKHERFDHTDKIKGLEKQTYLERREDDKVIYTRRAIDTSGESAAGPIKKLIPKDLFMFVETQTWHKQDCKAEWKMEPKAQKDMIVWKGVSTYKANGDRTERVINYTVKVKMPLIGGKLEQAVMSGFKNSMDDDYRTINEMAQLIKSGKV